MQCKWNPVSISGCFRSHFHARNVFRLNSSSRWFWYARGRKIRYHFPQQWKWKTRITPPSRFCMTVRNTHAGSSSTGRNMACAEWKNWELSRKTSLNEWTFDLRVRWSMSSLCCAFPHSQSIGQSSHVIEHFHSSEKCRFSFVNMFTANQFPSSLPWKDYSPSIAPNANGPQSFGISHYQIWLIYKRFTTEK